MSGLSIYETRWIDLVFENRNQSYGAYVLRKESGNYLLKALLLAVLMLSSVIIFSSFSWEKEVVESTPEKENPNVLYVTDVEIAPKTKLEQPKTEQSQKPAQEIQDLKSVNISGAIKPSNSLDAKELPDIKTIETSIISNIDQSGKDAQAGLNANSGDKTGNATGTGNGEDSNGIENIGTVEIMPEFVGGMEAWAKFLEKNLRYPSQARDEGVQGRVTISFVVEKNGELSNIKVLKGIGFGCDEEAKRVIAKSPFWKPGIQNGRAVRVSYVMPIVFRLD